MIQEDWSGDHEREELKEKLFDMKCVVRVLHIRKAYVRAGILECKVSVIFGQLHLTSPHEFQSTTFVFTVYI